MGAPGRTWLTLRRRSRRGRRAQAPRRATLRATRSGQPRSLTASGEGRSASHRHSPPSAHSSNLVRVRFTGTPCSGGPHLGATSARWRVKGGAEPIATPRAPWRSTSVLRQTSCRWTLRIRGSRAGRRRGGQERGSRCERAPEGTFGTRGAPGARKRPQPAGVNSLLSTASGLPSQLERSRDYMPQTCARCCPAPSSPLWRVDAREASVRVMNFGRCSDGAELAARSSR